MAWSWLVASGDPDALPRVERLAADLGGQAVDQGAKIAVRVYRQGDGPERVAGTHDPCPRRDRYPTAGAGRAGGGEGSTTDAIQRRTNGDRGEQEEKQPQSGRDYPAPAVVGGGWAATGAVAGPIGYEA